MGNVKSPIQIVMTASIVVTFAAVCFADNTLAGGTGAPTFAIVPQIGVVSRNSNSGLKLTAVSADVEINAKTATTTLKVTVRNGRPIFNLAASFQVPESGLEHQADMPQVEGPEGLQDVTEVAADILQRIPEKIQRREPPSSALARSTPKTCPLDDLHPPRSREGRSRRHLPWSPHK